jgi:hypothetical protein
MPRLTLKQEAFVRAIASGMTQEAAVAKAYPGSLKWEKESREKRAAYLLSMEHVRKAYLAILEECRTQEQEWLRWTREDHIKTLVQSIREIESEIDRRKQALEAEVGLLRQLAERADDDAEDKIEYELAAQRALQRPLINAATTRGLVSASESLSRLLGLTREANDGNLSMSFVGEGEL